MRPESSRPTIFAAGLACCAAGCVSEYHGGAQLAAQPAGPVTQSATLGVGAGLGDGDGALTEIVEGSVGVDERSRRFAGSFAGGFEYFTYGGVKDTSDRFALLAGYAGTSADKSGVFLLTLRYGHGWVLNGEDTGNDLTSISLDPLVALALAPSDGTRPSGIVLGLGVTFRRESFTSWRFHF